MGAQCIPCCYNSIHWYNFQNGCSVQFICPGSNRFSKPWNNSSTAYLSEPWRHSAVPPSPCLACNHPLSPLTLDMTSSLSLFTVDSLRAGFRNELCTNEWMDRCLLMLTKTISSHTLHRQAVWKFVECGTDITAFPSKSEIYWNCFSFQLLVQLHNPPPMISNDVTFTVIQKLIGEHVKKGKFYICLYFWLSLCKCLI